MEVYLVTLTITPCILFQLKQFCILLSRKYSVQIQMKPLLKSVCQVFHVMKSIEVCSKPIMAFTWVSP